VRRLVHVSTEAVLLAGKPLVNVDESAPLRPDSKSPYCSSKAKAEQLVRDANETVVLSVWDGDTAVVVRVDDNTDRTIRISVRPGARLSLTSSAQGRVFCAFLPEDDVDGLSAILKKSPDLRAELETIRKAGISLNSPVENGVRTLAAPVFQDSRIVATMAIVGTTASISERVGSPAARALGRAARALSETLGSSPG
jgi:IclR family pca regulon transcriptional regulator